MTDQSSSQKVKSAQLRNLMILIGVVLLGLALFAYLLGDYSSRDLLVKDEPAQFSSPLVHVDAESVILEKTEKQLHEDEKKTDSLEQQLDLLKNNKNSEDENNQKAVEELSKRLATLEKRLSEPQTSFPENEQALPTMVGSEAYRGNFLPEPAGNKTEQVIREDTLSLGKIDDRKILASPFKNPDSYVPPGTFVKAVMLGGADASASVNSQSNPVPMLFRIIANGTLPNHRHSHLKDCFVTAAVVGDISSERGFIRLENLSCTFPNNEVVDQAVEGTIFGSEGKNGVRGRPVWREGALLQRAFVAGTLSGLSEGLSQTYSTNSISAQGNVQTINPANIFQYGAAKGTGKAMDKLADYNIQRAEQYHPIIQLSAGTEVDVVFLKGFYLDGKKHENQDTISSYPPSSSSASQDLASTFFPSQEAQSLPLTPDQVRHIQEKEKQLGLRGTNDSHLKETT